MLTWLSVSELCVILGVFVCLGVLVAKNTSCHSVWSCLSVLHQEPHPFYATVMCWHKDWCCLQQWKLDSGFWHGGFPGGGHWIGQGRDGEETWGTLEMLVSFKCSMCLGWWFFVLLPSWLTKAVLTATQSAYLHSCSCHIVKIAYG